MHAVQKPVVDYVSVNGAQVAHQVFGSGKVNLVLAPWSVSNLDHLWVEPGLRGFLGTLGGFAKVALYDKGGTGLSDRSGGAPDFDARMADMAAVMDEAGFGDAVVVGMSEGVASSILFAAFNPKRVRGLVLISGAAKGLRSKDYPWGGTKDQYEASFRWSAEHWGDEQWREKGVAAMAPSRLGDSAFTNWLSEMRLAGASKETSLELARMEMLTDVRDALPLIRAPTMVVNVAGDKASDSDEGRYVADRIAGARFVELPGVDHMFFADPDLAMRVADELKRFSLSAGPPAPTVWSMAAVMVASISDAAARAEKAGPGAWQALLDKYYDLARAEIQKAGGVEVGSGEGTIVATFRGASSASKCASAVAGSGGQLGVQVRSGVHVGDCSVGLDGAIGPAVEVATQAQAEAIEGEALVTRTTKTLALDPRVVFRDAGERRLGDRGGRQRLFSVEQVLPATGSPSP